MLDTPKAEQPLDILLVESKPGGVHLAVHALKESASPSHLVILRDAAEAQQFLHGSGKRRIGLAGLVPGTRRARVAPTVPLAESPRLEALHRRCRVRNEARMAAGNA